MILAIYKGTTLLSISYCNRKLKELNEKYTLEHIREYDITLETLEKDEALNALTKSISYYNDIIERLENNFANIEDDDLIKFVIEQIIFKIKESKLNKVSLSFYYVSEYTVEIRIDNVFSTELTLKKKVYENSYELNEHYDGYNDTSKFVSIATATSFLKETISTVKKAITEELPEISIH